MIWTNNSANFGTRKMKFRSFDCGDDGKHSPADSVGICKIFAIKDELLNETASLDRVNLIISTQERLLNIAIGTKE